MSKSVDIETPLTLEAIEAGTISFKNESSAEVIYKINGVSNSNYIIAKGTTGNINVHYYRFLDRLPLIFS